MRPADDLSEIPPPGPRALALWAGGMAASMLAFTLILQDQGAAFPWAGATLHLLSTGLAVGGTLEARGREHPAGVGWAVLVGFFALFGGPLGYVGALAAYVHGTRPPGEVALVDSVRPEEPWIRAARVEEAGSTPSFELQLREELRTQPIVDLLPYADVPTAIAIINRLAEKRAPDDVRLLRHLTMDRRPEVYQYALAKVGELEKEFATRIYELKEQLKYRPQDPGLRVEMAKLYLEYTDSGLLDTSLQDYYWELTLAQLFEAMLVQPSDTDLVVDLGRLFLSQELYREAEVVLEEALRKEPGNLRGQLMMLQCLLERAQAESRPELILEARKRALEASWAVRIPDSKDRSPQALLSEFWFTRQDGRSPVRGSGAYRVPAGLEQRPTKDRRPSLGIARPERGPRG